MSKDHRGDDARPIIVAVDDDAGRRALLHDELRRYEAAYRLHVAASPAAARSALEEGGAGGRRGVVVVASQRMADMHGAALLSWVRSRHPRSKRALLVAGDDWGHEETATAIRSAIASGCIDHYLGTPAKPGDEAFHRAIGGLL